MNQKATIILMLGLMPSATAADSPKIRCEVHPADKRAYWAWRQIDGRQCWFRGHSSMPKNQLFWDRDEVKPGSEIKAELHVAEEPSQPSIVIMHPRLGTIFEWHWRDLMIEMNQPVWSDRRLMQEWRLP